MTAFATRLMVIAVLAAGWAAGAAAEEPQAKQPKPAALTGAQIVAKNAAARGGLDAWRKVRSMVWTGHMESASANVPGIAFVLDQERPNKTRFEITAMRQKTMRVFDGEHGWSVRASRDGSTDLQPYTDQELKFAREAQVIDGPLIDSAARGSRVALEGIDQVEGRKAYRLSVHLASGEPQKVWIDAQSFLDVRYDRVSYNSAGMPGIVTVFYRRYQKIEGLLFPTTLEIGVGSGKPPDRMVIEKIALNPPLDAQTFAKPAAPRSRSAAAPVPASAPAAAARAALGVQPTAEIK